MDAEIKKSLTDLIDETLMELEELKKSKFSAAEIKIDGPGDSHLAGKPVNGDLHAKAEDKKDEDEEDKDDDKDMDKGENEKADPNAGHHQPVAKGENEKADPNGGHHQPVAKAEDKKDDDKDDEKKDKDSKGGERHEAEEKKAIGKLADLAGMKKSEEEMQSLMKSYFDERVKPLEDSLASIMDLVKKIADQPVAPKGATVRTVPLLKSTEEVETLSKAQVATKLFDLKKSGSAVDSLDVTKAEMGQDLDTIIRKYKLS